jgi:hypothetical protein
MDTNMKKVGGVKSEECVRAPRTPVVGSDPGAICSVVWICRHYENLVPGTLALLADSKGHGKYTIVGIMCYSGSRQCRAS